tara:strand:- start:261 stop:914 length:654 start_codon:yes stop_codon:yes gene_type:complete
MEKEEKNNQNLKSESLSDEEKKELRKNNSEDQKNNEQNIDEKDEQKKQSPEEIILELEEKLTRTFAEMENQRRRYEKEKEDAYEYGGFVFAKEALALIDNLERSKDILKNDEKLKNTDALNKTLEHFDIIYKDLISIFNKNNIKPIESINKKLDPNYHQAMMEIEDDSKDPGTIIKEIQKGFLLKDRLLRPSLVGVSKKPSKNEEKNEEIKENSEDK